MPRELIGLDALGVCAVKGTLSAIRSLSVRSEDLQRQARRVLEQAAQEREDLLAALTMELGVSFPAACRFRLQGSTLEVLWDGPPDSLTASPEEPEELPAEEEAQPVEEAESVEQEEPEEAPAVWR